jgi:alpha-mannosidase
MRTDGSHEMTRSVWNHKQNAVAEESLFLFGNGDGGGGPTPKMLEKVSPEFQ